MKVAFVGKGGSGKTTLSALFARYLAEVAPVVAVDADINQHLGVALGLDDQAAGSVPALGEHLEAAKEYLRGTNPRIRGAAEMVKTTPPGRGSRLLRVDGDDPFHRDWAVQAGKVRLLATGPFAEEDLGVACYHAKIGAVELYLNHLLDGPGEYVLVDMTAGADSFASGLFTRFDLAFMVAEPTRRGVSVYRQYLDYARGYDIALRVIGNKVNDEADVRYLRAHIGEDLLGWVTASEYVRSAEQGHVGPLDALEPENTAVLATMHAAVDGRVKDWRTFQRQAEQFHVRNALAWANTALGVDLRTQIDPGFIPGPAASNPPEKPAPAAV